MGKVEYDRTILTQSELHGGGASRDLGMSAENGGIYAMRTASVFSTRKPRINLYRCS